MKEFLHDLDLDERRNYVRAQSKLMKETRAKIILSLRLKILTVIVKYKGSNLQLKFSIKINYFKKKRKIIP